MTNHSQTISVESPLAHLTQRRIFLFWLPLAASWIFMGFEMPFVNAILARLPDTVRMIAAFGVVGSVSITIESPVIMLLATSTALARSRQNYLRLRQFTWHLMALTTLIHILLAWTPLFDVVVRDWMGLPTSLIDLVQLGLRSMVVWSAAIAWRRFRQGIMIRYNQTASVGQGTLIRLTASAGTALVLATLTDIPGVAVGGLGLSVGVLSEAAFAHWASRKLVEEKFGTSAPATEASELSYGELVKFHTPLAASSLLFLLTQPMVSAALARLPNPETILAAWPVTSGLLFITRAPALALPEAIIALGDTPHSAKALREFCLKVGLICTGVLALIGFTPLGSLYFHTFIGVKDELALLAAAGAQTAVLLPVVMGAQSWLRGVLTANRQTGPTTLAMGINLLTMALVLGLGVVWRAPGVMLAAGALNLSIGAETLVLWWAARRSKATLPA